MDLLAKSTPHGGMPKTLVEHTEDVVDAAASLFGTREAPKHLGRSWLRFFRLAQDDWATFHETLLAACLFHDWGKANRDMLDVLRGEGGHQLFRHEHLSVLLLACPGVEAWLRQRSDIDWNIVLAAVGSHHLRFSDSLFAAGGIEDTVELLIDHPDFQNLLIPLGAQRLSLSGTPVFLPQRFWGFVRRAGVFNPSELRDSLCEGPFRQLTRDCRNPQNARARMLNAVRSGLIVADGAGSGLPRTGKSIEWIDGQFSDVPECKSGSVRDIALGRVRQLKAADRWKGDATWDSQGWNVFQLGCDTLPSRSLLLAPCGSGKTLAAWRWIAAHVENARSKRVLFLYPTRATATEGFKDYVSWAPESDATLLHGTAGFDLDGMFPAEDPRHASRFNDTDPRLFAIRHWSKRIFSATIDQFFAFLSYDYGPMCLLPLLAESVIVVDEVHSFDRSVFSALLGFLKNFDVPVLCMTATLPQHRQLDLVEAGLHLSNPKPDDLRSIADAPRYKVLQINRGEAEQKVRDSLAAGKRVLWVVNQVSRAQEIAQKLSDLQMPVVCYHSRFRLGDRVERHQETVKLIRPKQGAAVVISTQVCEMSLDIDADVLVTENCPITSLIQRMGRCRRGREELAEKGWGEVYVYDPGQEERVYTPADLAGLEGFLKFLVTKSVVSQADLEIGLEQFGPTTAEAPKQNSFLASGPYAVGDADSFRDSEEFNVQSVLGCDVESYVRAGDRKPEFIVPVPRKLKPPADPRLPHHLHVADERHYDPRTGFWDQPIV